MSAAPAPTPRPVYADTYDTYLDAGWHSPLPLPPGRKKHPPQGYTGNHGRTPSYADCHTWADERPDSNIALRLPDTVVGIDVDNYDQKTGGTELADAEHKWGPLPATWRTTSRDDGISGIRLYQVPAGLAWPTGVAPSIEIIRHAHRYAVVWPSVHPNGGTYRWINPDGLDVAHVVPTPHELPHLPDAWVHGLTGGREREHHDQATMTLAEAGQWLVQRPQGDPCRAVQHVITQRTTDLLTHSSTRHDVMLDATQRLAHLAAEGHTGTFHALTTLKAVFMHAVTTDGTRSSEEADQEWTRALEGAIRNAATTPTGDADPCTDPFHGLIDRRTPPSPPPTSTPTDATSTPAPTSPASTTPTPGSTAPPSTSAPTDTTGPADGPAPQDTQDSTSPSGAESTTLDPDRAHEYYLQEIARVQGRAAAQRWYDEHHRDEVIADRVRRREIDETATHEWRKQAQGAQDPPQPVNLTTLLAQDDDPVRYRVADLWPAGGRVVLAAPAKAGKSTTVTNLVKSLADHTPFLGTYQVHPPSGRIVVIDNELDPRQIRANYRAQGITNTDSIEIIPLRGRVATFDITDPTTRAEWAEKLKEMGASVVIFDCLRPLIDALGLSEDKDAGRVLVAFDALLSDAGIEDGLVVHHMGHNGERSRGDTRIRDWPDAEWKIVKQAVEDGENDDQAPRFFSAFGRDVSVPESQLALDHATRTLTVAGGNRAQARLQPHLQAVTELLQRTDGPMSGNQIERWLMDEDHPQKKVRDALKEGLRNGVLRFEQGERNAKLYTLTTPQFVSSSTTSTHLVNEQSESPRQTPLKGFDGDELRGPDANPVRQSAQTTLCTTCGTRLDDTEALVGDRCQTCRRTTPNHPGPEYRLDYQSGEYVHRDTGELWDADA